MPMITYLEKSKAQHLHKLHDLAELAAFQNQSRIVDPRFEEKNRDPKPTGRGLDYYITVNPTPPCSGQSAPP